MNLRELENYNIQTPDDLFLLFLPDFSMSTSLHFLIITESFQTFNRIVNQIDKNLFDEFLKKYPKKIKNLFIFILEYINTYPIKAIKNIYCNLPLDEEDLMDENDELFKNVLIVRKFLNRINEKIISKEIFSNRNDFFLID